MFPAIRDPARLILSGLVRRWHQYPMMAHTDETDAQHQWMVAALALSLFPDASRALMFEALFHDVGELVAGDLGLPFKEANPDFAAGHAWIELEARRGICGVASLTAVEALQLKLCDRLAAFLWMLIRTPHLSSRLDWIGDHDRIRSLARDLGVLSPVQGLIGEIAGWPPVRDADQTGARVAGQGLPHWPVADAGGVEG